MKRKESVIALRRLGAIIGVAAIGYCMNYLIGRSNEARLVAQGAGLESRSYEGEIPGHKVRIIQCRTEGSSVPYQTVVSLLDENMQPKIRGLDNNSDGTWESYAFSVGGGGGMVGVTPTVLGGYEVSPGGPGISPFSSESGISQFTGTLDDRIPEARSLLDKAVEDVLNPQHQIH